MVNRELSGREVCQMLEQAASEARRRSVALRGESDRLNQSMRQLLDHRAERLEDLAEHYLPELSKPRLDASFADVRQKVQGILERKLEQEEALRTSWDSLLDQRRESELELDKLAKRLDELSARRAELEQTLTSMLEGNPEFERLSAAALAAERELEYNEQRVAESRQEAADKLPAYDGNGLFRYLYKKGYGSANYRAGGLTRILDRWVAKLVHFGDNKQSYEFLRVTPELMAAEVDRRRSDFTRLMQQVEAIEDNVSDEIGLTDVLREGDEAARRRDALVDTLSKQTERREALEQQMRELAKPGNKFHREGIDRLRDYFASLHDAALEVRARQTSEPIDDQIVAEISKLGAQADQSHEQALGMQQKLDRWHERLAGLDYVLQRFRRDDFDSGRSIFSGRVHFQNEINAYLDGRQTKDDLWRTFAQAQRFTNPEYSSGSWGDIGDLIDSDVSHVLFEVLAHTAGAAMRQAARRGMTRRGPVRRTQRKSSGRPPIHRGRRGGFTTGGGF